MQILDVVCMLGVDDYALSSVGMCASAVRSQKECDAAAKRLGLSDYTSTADGLDHSSTAPVGCYLDEGTLKFNDAGNNGNCSSTQQCLCSFDGEVAELQWLVSCVLVAHTHSLRVTFNKHVGAFYGIFTEGHTPPLKLVLPPLQALQMHAHAYLGSLGI